jgi:general secretion pathway protein A
MAEGLADTLLKVRGVLNQTLPGVFRDQLPAILARYRNMPVRLLVTTETDALDRELARHGNFYRPARGGDTVQFTWKASGPFHAVVRQFRLDFLRHLGAEELGCEIFMGIFLLDPPGGMARATPAAEEGAGDGPAAATDPDRQPAPAWTAGEETRILQVSRDSSIIANPLRAARPAPPPLIAQTPDPNEVPAANVAAVADPILFTAPDSESSPGIDPRAESTVTLAPLPPAHATKTDGAPSAPAPPRTPRPERPAPEPHGLPLPGNLYQDYFGFARMPFNNTPDPRFFFPTAKHQEALSRLIYAISERKGFVMISGEIGSGKSTLCRTLLSQLPRQVKTALITHTHIDASQIVRAIGEDLNLPVDGLNSYEALQVLNQYLIEQLAEGCTVCIIIDEAQNLSPEALEEVRMISNLETTQEKLVQLILLGQPELRQKVRLPGMQQLRQRIAVQYHLDPLARGETLEYIAHRLKVAGPTEPIEFQRGAMLAAHEYSGGVPRLINTLCDNALLTAYCREERTIAAGLIREAAQDLDLEAREAAGLRGFFNMW